MRRKIIVKAPALSQSGYGVQSRFALRSLKKHQDKFDIYLLNLNWGRTGWIIENTEERRWIDDLIGKTQIYLAKNPNNPGFDVSLQVTIPNEFEPMAPVNIGYTAGIETTRVSPEWLIKTNSMNRIIVPSNHSKNVFKETSYESKNEHSVTTKLSSTTPVDVIGYAATIVEPKPIELDLETKFNFLTVAQWGPRKNLESVIGCFINEFSKAPDVGLVVKTNTSKNNLADKLNCERMLGDLLGSIPNAKNRKCQIYLLHGNFNENEMAGLYTNPKIKALVTATHGEGFGLPMFESVLHGLPVIAPAWSGHVDFLYAPKKDIETGKIRLRPHFTKIDFDMAQIQKDAVSPGILQEDSQWCYPKNYSIRAALTEVYKNHGAALAKAKKLKEFIVQEFDETKQYNKFVNSIIKEMPEGCFDDPVKSELEKSLDDKNILTDIVGL